MMPARRVAPGAGACLPRRDPDDFDLQGGALVGFTGFLAIGFGGALGCWLRWLLGSLLNHLFPTLPPGTLAANLLGGLLMGGAMGVWDHFQTLPPELRLFVFTGFLGGLTTFSTFSAESSTLLLRQQYLWFTGHLMVHLAGSVGLTLLGIALARILLRSL